MDGYTRASGFVLYPYVFVAGANKHDVLVVSHVLTKREILTGEILTGEDDKTRASVVEHEGVEHEGGLKDKRRLVRVIIFLVESFRIRDNLQTRSTHQHPHSFPRFKTHIRRLGTPSHPLSVLLFS